MQILEELSQAGVPRGNFNIVIEQITSRRIMMESLQQFASEGENH